MAKNITVSIITVHYKVPNELFACLDSIIASKPKVAFEIMVVDNDEKPTIQKFLEKQFPQVRYMQSGRNVGFGTGNNLGAKFALGEFLFFLNPDTLVQASCIDALINFIKKNKNIGIVAPLLLDRKNKPFSLQGSMRLTPLRAIICLSFINKYFPHNPIAREYFLLDWNKKSIKEVDVVPGTAFVIRKNIFERINGFDGRFFLFFEEDDICIHVQKMGLRLFMHPEAKVVHLWGRSTKKGKNITQIFRQSRFLYFQKYYGKLWANIVELFCR